MQYITNSPEETKRVAQALASEITSYSTNKDHKGAGVVGFYGDLGAGKTTFIQYLAQAFGIKDSVVSPTFVIEKIYELGLAGRPFSHFIHIDAYRIEDSKELISLGWEKIISKSDNLIFIEWPERVADIMPPHMKVMIDHISENSRKIEVLKQ